MTPRILAAIDVGSNSVRLMVARAEGGTLTPLKTGLITTRLMNGIQNGRLTGDPVLRTAEAVAEHTETARAMGAIIIDAFGTSALRDAENRDEFSVLTERLCGIRVRVISGEEEAQLAYAGAAPEGNACVVDIGGGSTELIAGREGLMLRAHSAQIGAVRLMNLVDGRLNAEEMCVIATDRLRETIHNVCTEKAERWIGVGGTITTLAAMTKKVSKYSPGAVEHFPLTESAAANWLERLCAMSLEQRRNLVGLPLARADIIPYGAAILLSLMRAAQADPILACDRDNLEGYMRRHMLNPT